MLGLLARFYGLAGKLVPWCAALAVLLTAWGLYIGLGVAPTDFQQGDPARLYHARATERTYARLAEVARLALEGGISVGQVMRTIAPVYGALGVCLMLPRLVAGAHWGADAFVGGVLLSLLALAWSCYTPLGHHASEWLEKITLPLTRQLAKLPLLGHLSVISGR